MLKKHFLDFQAISFNIQISLRKIGIFGVQYIKSRHNDLSVFFFNLFHNIVYMSLENVSLDIYSSTSDRLCF